MDKKLEDKLIALKIMLRETLAMAPDEGDCETDAEEEMYGTMQSLYEEISDVLV